MDIPVRIACYFVTEEARIAQHNAELMGCETQDMDELYLLQDVYFTSMPVAVFNNPEGEGVIISTASGDFRTPMLLDDVLTMFDVKQFRCV